MHSGIHAAVHKKHHPPVYYSTEPQNVKTVFDRNYIITVLNNSTKLYIRTATTDLRIIPDKMRELLPSCSLVSCNYITDHTDTGQHKY